MQVCFFIFGSKKTVQISSGFFNLTNPVDLFWPDWQDHTERHSVVLINLRRLPCCNSVRCSDSCGELRVKAAYVSLVWLGTNDYPLWCSNFFFEPMRMHIILTVPCADTACMMLSDIYIQFAVSKWIFGCLVNSFFRTRVWVILLLVL